MRTKLSLLDVGVLHKSVQLAPRVEALGYHRYWISEHHGEGAIPNPTLLVPVIAGLTDTIRVGTAGIQLRFQSPLAVAENFRMLNRLFPGRIDAGLVRAWTAREVGAALSDGRPDAYSAEDHAARVMEVQRLLCGQLPPDHPLAGVHIDPPLIKAGPPPLWVHSTSANGAQLAASIGSSYAFHDYYDHAAGPASAQQYAETFCPSPELERPVWAVCVAGFCAANDAEAREIREQKFGREPPGRRPIIGTMSYWRDQLGEIVQAYRTGEVIIQSLWRQYDVEQQVDSLARIAEVAQSLEAPMDYQDSLQMSA
jgi:luciferase family oxidoreductase group 1